jgi:hypothetical protein
METNQQDQKQIPSSTEAPKSFFQKNIVGVIVFFLMIFYSLLRSGNFGSMIIDIPISLLVALVIQLIFKGLQKLFTK